MCAILFLSIPSLSSSLRMYYGLFCLVPSENIRQHVSTLKAGSLVLFSLYLLGTALFYPALDISMYMSYSDCFSNMAFLDGELLLSFIFLSLSPLLSSWFLLSFYSFICLLDFSSMFLSFFSISSSLVRDLIFSSKWCMRSYLYFRSHPIEPPFLCQFLYFYSPF